MGTDNREDSQNTKPIDSGGERDEKGRFTKKSAAKFGAKGGAAGKGSISIVSILKQRLQHIPKNSKKNYAEMVVDQWIAGAVMQGDFNALKEIVRYVDGMPKQSTDLTIDDRSVFKDFDGLPPGEREEAMRRYVKSLYESM